MDGDPNAVDDLPPDGLKRLLASDRPVALLDVREHAERAYCRIAAPAGAADLHVPLGTIPGQLDEIRAAAEGRTLVVYCHHGVRSMAAARWLAARGLGPVANLDGGIDAWSVEADPTVRRYH